jgi:transcriptional regulator with XRE-family HTH domain
MISNLNKLRKLRGISQDQIASILMVSRQTVSNWERGVYDPTIDQLIIIANILAVTVDDLLNRNPVYNEIDKIEDVFSYVAKTYKADDIRKMYELIETYLRMVDRHERRNKKDQ